MSRPVAGSRAAELRKLLLRIARARNEDFQFTLSRYGVERLLYRLSSSRHQGAFVLKGAMLVATWMAVPYRATRDLDLLGTGNPGSERLAALFREVVMLDGGDDALAFHPDSVRAEEIRADDRYGGVRVRIAGDFGGAAISIQIDVAFGMKDFYDVWILAREFSFSGAALARAVRATFNRRGTELSVTLPQAWGIDFNSDPAKIQLWKAFLDRAHVPDRGLTLQSAVGGVQEFAWPALQAANTEVDWNAGWAPGGPWR